MELSNLLGYGLATVGTVAIALESALARLSEAKTRYQFRTLSTGNLG